MPLADGVAEGGGLAARSGIGERPMMGWSGVASRRPSASGSWGVGVRADEGEAGAIGLAVEFPVIEQHGVEGLF